MVNREEIRQDLTGLAQSPVGTGRRPGVDDVTGLVYPGTAGYMSP